MNTPRPAISLELEEGDAWNAAVDRYKEHNEETRRLISIYYNELRNGGISRAADLCKAISMAEAGHERAASELSAQEYEDIIKGEEIWASMSINSES